MTTPRPVRIGNAHGFWGDRIGAAADMLAREPDLDYLTLDFLAEVSMSILALQRSRDPDIGYPRDFVEVIRSLTPYFRAGGRCRIVANAGGLNPLACAHACLNVLQEAGCTDRTIGVVTGDDVLEFVRQDAEPIADRLFTANAYLGAESLVQALTDGADIVITGRVADPSLTLAPCIHHFGWSLDDWNRLAGGTVAGHLIECGTQVTGGVSTDWLDMPDAAGLGFPIVEVAADGSCVVTKPANTGGRVTEQTVKEQLVYEIGDPGRYLSPDVTVSFLSLSVAEVGPDRVRVAGAQGQAPPETYKVSATYRNGYRAAGQLTVVGRDAVAKARRAGEAVLERLRRDGCEFRESLVECLGAGACRPQGADDALAARLTETVLRITVADESREAVERFTRELMPLVTAGPQGTTGYAEGRPRVHPVFRYWPTQVARNRVTPEVQILRLESSDVGPISDPALPVGRVSDPSESSKPRLAKTQGVPPAGRVGDPSYDDAERRSLRDIAYARSGDKGTDANIGVVARRAEDYDWLQRELTAERVATYFQLDDVQRVERYELPNLGALNFVIRGILANSLRTDAQGKTLGQILLEMPIPT